MSLQLVYTSALHLIDSSLSGYGTVARSESIPRLMRRKLMEMSRLREDSKRGILGPQYSYRTLEYGGQEYHVFTSTRPAGADYSGRACHISHHMVLLPEEVAAMRRNPQRPTPAGMILALIKCGFWLPRWEGEPKILNGEPRLTAEHLPNAEKQPTWKRMTGHKRNVRAFFTPPFERDCLITVPPGTQTEDILRLLHESDWLAPHCGWGKTFTTYADERDSFMDTMRLACVEGSKLINKSMRTGHPVLPISQELELEGTGGATDSVAIPSPENGFTPDEVGFREHLAARQAARLAPPYQYNEERDEDMYATGLCRRNVGKWCAIGIGSALLLGTASIGIIQLCKNPPISPHTAMELFLASAYDEHTLHEQLESIEDKLDPENSAHDKDILAIINILREAASAQHHANNLITIVELAKKLHLNPGSLSLRYLQEATHNRPLEEWKASFSRDEIQSWETLNYNYPEIQRYLEHPDLSKYFTHVINDVEVQSSTHTEAEKTPIKTVSETTHIVRVGEALSPGLKNLLDNKNSKLTAGQMRLIPIDGGNILQYSLSPHKQHLQITPSNVSGVYHISLINAATSLPTPAPPISLTLQDSRITRISCKGKSIALILPIPTEQGGIQEVLLVPSISISLTGIHSPEVPDLVKKDFKIKHEDLKILPPTSEHLSVHLQLQQGFGRWLGTSQDHSTKQTFSFKLPRLADKNIIAKPIIADNNPVAARWNGCEIVSVSPETITVNCTLVPHSNLEQRLATAFHNIANEGCCGKVSSGDPLYSLASLYSSMELYETQEETSRTAARKRYSTLFSHKAFNGILCQLLAKYPELIIPYDIANSQSAVANNKRNLILDRLDKIENRNRIRSRIRQTISQALFEAYQSEQEQAALDIGIRLQLRQIGIGKDDEFIWQFLLHPITAKEQPES